MSREVRRVPLDFDYPLGKTWDGYLMPKELHLPPCPNCDGRGYSPEAQHLHDLWYGYVPFDPASTGSTRLTHKTPAVRAFAERNVGRAPEYYGTGELAIVREACRLAKLWNGMWSHHLTQDDVDALVEGGRLMDFTHTWAKGEGWRPKQPPVTPTAEQVNDWSLRSFGHDAINASIVVSARCQREGKPVCCATCNGTAAVATDEQRAAREAWKPTPPPVGEGWQLWQTVSEGGPVSPVFPDAEGLAQWLVNDAGALDRCSSIEVARRFVEAGWAPSGFSSAETGYVQGPEFIGSTAGGES